MHARAGSLLGTVVGLLVLVAPAAAAPHNIVFGGGTGNRYDPSTLRIARGDTLNFQGAFPNHPLHDAQTDTTLADGSYAGSEYATAPISTAGRYVFYCEFHGSADGGMRTVVTASDNQPPTVTIDGPTTIASGDTATFTANAADPDGSITKYEWDLDGNGTFETVDDNTVSKAYTGGQTVSVKVRVTDDNATVEPTLGNESATAARTLTVSAPPSTGGGDPPPSGVVPTPTGGGQAGGATPPPDASPADTTAPRLTLSTSGRKPLRVVLTVSERATAVIRLKKGRSVMAKATVTLAKGTRKTVNLKLSSAAKTMLKAARKVKGTLTVTVKDAAGNATTRTKSVTLRA